MATAPRKGYNPARSVGSGADNKGLSEYTIASGYSTALGTGDIVALTGTADNIAVGANSAYNLGVFHAVTYTDPTTGRLLITDYWPASQVATDAKALVMDAPQATFNAICTNPIGDMVVGTFYATTLTAPDSFTHRSSQMVNNTVAKTGSLAVTGTNNAGLAGLANSDAFAISTSVHTTPVTITIVTNQTPAQLLALLNAVPGISAALNSSTHYLTITVTDGGDLILADGTGTPLADSNLVSVAGTFTPNVAKASSAVKIVKIIDTVNYVVEVCLTNEELQDNR